MKIYKKLTLSSILFFTISAQVYANAASGDFPDKTPAEINSIVMKTLEKLGSGYIKQEITNGFTYRYTNTFLNLYPFDIYIGEFNKGSMMRIESIDKTNHALLSVFMTEALNTKFPITHQQKSVILGDLLTLVLPAAGNIYTIVDSPFNIKLSWLFSILYLGIDVGLIYVGGTTFFTHTFDPFKKGLPATLALLGTHRLAHLIFNHISIVAHNRMIQVGYTFQFD